GGIISGLETFKQMNPPAIVDDVGNMVAGVNHWDSRTGSFEFLPLPAGTYTLLLSGQDEGGVYSMRPQRIVLDHDRPDLLLHVKPVLTIPITVRLELIYPSAFPRTCSGGFIGLNGTVYSCNSLNAIVSMFRTDSYNMQVNAIPEGEKDAPTLAFHGISPGK